MTNRELSNVFRRAKRGDEAALKSLAKENDILAQETNKRMKELEEAGFDYYSYNTVANFAYSEYDHGKRLLTSKSKYLHGDPYAQYKQVKIAKAFLNTRTSTVEGQREILEERIQTWRERGLFGSYWRNGKLVIKKGDPDQAAKFFRFLSNQEFEDLNEYGDSSVVVEALYRAYTSKAVGPERALEIFREHMESGERADQLINKLIGKQRGGTYADILRKRSYINRR